MKNKKLFFILLIVGVIIIIGILMFVFTSPNKSIQSISSKISPISIIRYVDENSSVILTKNNVDKTAKVDMALFMEKKDLENEFFDMTNFTTTLTCGFMSMAFFNQTALKDFNDAIGQWNQMNGTIEDNTGKDLGKPESNPLEGYSVTSAHFYLKDKSTQTILSECTITGASESDIKISIK